MENIVAFYHQLPKTSPVRSGLLKEATKQMTTTQASELFSVHPRTIERACTAPIQHTLESQLQPNIIRNRLKKIIPTITSFFKISTTTESGRSYASFQGTLDKLYKKYCDYCQKINKKPACASTFHKLQKEHHIGIFTGDQYSNPRWIQLQSLLAQQEIIITSPTTDESLNQLQQLQQKTIPLQEHHDNANWMRQKFKEDLQNLTNEPTTAILIVDFTKWNQVTSGNVHDFVAVLCESNGRTNFNFLAESTKELKIKQTFPYVKTAILKLIALGHVDIFNKIILYSDGGPGHFKVTKHNNNVLI